MQALTEKETTILKFLYHVFPESATKDELLTEVWGLQNGLTTHTLETHIYRLRQKIGRLTSNRKWISVRIVITHTTWLSSEIDNCGSTNSDRSRNHGIF